MKGPLMGNEKGIIYLVPIGPVPGPVMEELVGRLSETFHAEVSALGELPPLGYAFNRKRRQYDAALLIEELAAMGLEGLALGVMEGDLYATGLNFVFGSADPARGVAVISLARLRQEFYRRKPDEKLVLERTVKEAVHELGHLLGLPHCRDMRCVMYFSNSLPDTDRKTRRFCDACRERVTPRH